MLSHGRFAGSWDILEQNVSLRHKRRQDQLELFWLNDNTSPDGVHELFDCFTVGLLDSWSHNLHGFEPYRYRIATTTFYPETSTLQEHSGVLTLYQIRRNRFTTRTPL